MTIIQLSGYLPDKELSILIRVLTDAGLPVPTGRFTWIKFISDEDISEAVASKIASVFAPDTLDQVVIKQGIRATIIKMSETEKAKYITLVPGKSTAYIMKEQETIAYTSGERDPVKLPIMTLTAGINGRTLEEQYNLWLPNVMAWPLIGGRIEAKYDYQMAKLENTIFNDLPDVELFISEIDLLGIEPEPIEMPE